MVLIITLMGIFAMAARFSIGSDTWWHLAAGRLILEEGQILKTDPFSYTRAGADWKYPGWLAEIAMIWIYRAFGPGGLNVGVALGVTASFGLVWLALKGNVYFKAFLLVLAAAASGVYWAARPYMVTFLFSAAYLVILERERSWWEEYDSTLDGGEAGVQNNHLAWLLPAIMLLWGNSHGGFAVGFILYGLYFLGIFIGEGLFVEYWKIFRDRKVSSLHKFALIWKDNSCCFKNSALTRFLHKRFKFFIFIGLLMILALIVNPAGTDMLLYPFKTVGIEALQKHIQEWQSPNFHELRVLPFLVLLFFTFGIVGAAPGRISVLDFLLVVVFGGLALTAARNIALFALVSPIVISRSAVKAWKPLSKNAQWMDQNSENPSRLKQFLNWLILILGVGAAVYKASSVYSVQVNQAYIREAFPVEAAAQIQNQELNGRIFNSYNWGGYLIWTFPERRVFIDGRTDLYGDQIIDHWLTVVRAEEGWEEILMVWGAETIIIEDDWELNILLPNNDWQLIYEDDKAVVYARP